MLTDRYDNSIKEDSVIAVAQLIGGYAKLNVGTVIRINQTDKNVHIKVKWDHADKPAWCWFDKDRVIVLNNRDN